MRVAPGKFSRADQRIAWPWILVALGPVIMAILTWDTSGSRTPIQHWLRATGAPLVGLELLFVIYAIRCGLEPLRMLAKAPRWVGWFLVGLVLISAADSAFVADRPETATMRAGFSLTHVLFGLAVAHLSGIEKGWTRRTVWMTVLMGLLFYILVLALFVAAIPVQHSFDWRYLGLAVINVRHLGFYAAVGASIALASAASATSRLSYVMAIFGGAATFALAFWSGTRGAIVGLGLAYASLAAIFPQFRSIRALGSLLAMALFGALISLLHHAPNSHYGVERIAQSARYDSWNEIFSDRIAMWIATWRAILERPFFGHGQGQFGSAVPAFHHFTNPHNALLQALLDWGFIGGVVFVALAGFVLWRVWRKIRSADPSDLAPAFVAATLLTISLYDGSLYHTYPLMMISMAIGLLASGARADSAQGR